MGWKGWQQLGALHILMISEIFKWVMRTGDIIVVIDIFVRDDYHCNHNTIDKNMHSSEMLANLCPSSSGLICSGYNVNIILT